MSKQKQKYYKLRIKVTKFPQGGCSYKPLFYTFLVVAYSAVEANKEVMNDFVKEFPTDEFKVQITKSENLRVSGFVVTDAVRKQHLKNK